MADDRTWHLWREFPTPPYQRWACDVVRDASRPDGYRIVDSDTSTADAGFLNGLSLHMHQPHIVHQPPIEQDGAIYEVHGPASPGTPGHFEEAIRTTPNAEIRPMGRP